jgi:hypothetical protein
VLVGVSVGVADGRGLGVSVAVSLGSGLAIWAAAAGVTGTVALTMKSWLAGSVTAILAGITIGLLQALSSKKNNRVSAASFFMCASFYRRILFYCPLKILRNSN